MRHARQLLASFLCALAAVSGAFASNSDREAVAKARESLRRQLDEAQAAGVITVRREPQAAAPALRDLESRRAADVTPTACLTVEALQNASRMLEPDAQVALDALRSAVIENAGAKGSGPEIALARAYLVLGFAEEARAVALAREGAEAAGVAALALLAEGRPVEALEKSRPFRTCGGLYLLVEEAAAVLTRRQEKLSDASRTVMERLPAPLFRPIAEAMAIQAFEAGSRAAALPPLEAQSQQDKSEARLFLEAAAGDVRSRSTATLYAIGAKPGPLRAHALQALAGYIDGDAPESAQTAFDDDVIEVTEDDSGAGPVAQLSLILADRRAKQGDFSGAGRALASAYRYEATRAAASKKFASILSPAIRSQSSDERIAALAALGAFPALAAESLTDEDLRIAAGQMARLGAVNSIASVLAGSSLSPREIEILRGEAAFRAGDYDSAAAALAPHADERRVLELLRRVSIMKQDRSGEELFSQSLGQDAIVDSRWRAGNFAKLADLAGESSFTGANVEKALLANAALRRPAPAHLVARAPDERAGALFADAPDPKSADAAALLDFTRKLATSVNYLKKVLNDE